MDPSLPTGPEAIILDFMTRVLDDRDAGAVRTLSAYQRAYPGFEGVIAAEYQRLVRDPGSAEPTSSRGPEPVSIDPYFILEEIGRGGQAVVYLAEDRRLHRDVALKVLHAGRCDPERLLRFRREAEAASRLNHPGICPVFEAGEVDGTAYIAMAHIPGQSLDRYLESVRGNQPRPPLGLPAQVDDELTRTVVSARLAGPGETTADLWRILSFVERTARSVHAAHERGIIHRDLKPANIMVTPSGEPVLLDFGLARVDSGELATLTSSGDVFGTPAYMAPEQLQPERGRSDRRTDVYALGVVLYECIALRRPFEGPTREALYHAILDQEPSDPGRDRRDLPRDLGVVVATALAKEPDRRYQTALDFAEDLRRVRIDEPIAARPPGVWLRFRRWARRRPALAASLIGAFVLITSGLAMTMAYLHRTQEQLALTRRLSDLRALPYLEAVSKRELWPALPDRVRAMDLWLAEAEDVATRLDAHRRHFDAEDASAPAWDRERVMRTSFLGGADRLAGLIAEMHERRAFAAALRRRSIDEPAEAWRQAGERVAADPRFDGFALVPQLGLIPLGRDPDTDLEEFGHLASGEPPPRNSGGRLVLGSGYGVVLVLVPGGTAPLGVQDRDPDAPCYEPAPMPHPNPYREESLPPFFVSKFEFTQAQWMRIHGSNPSLHSRGIDALGLTVAAGLNPVESMTWTEATEVLRRVALRLPSMSEWEYAARAGTTSRWFTGGDSDGLEHFANVADLALEAENPGWAPLMSERDVAFDDGHAAHARVGSFLPNDFGLHDVHGNVLELMGERQDGHCLLRGGSFRHSAAYARSGFHVRTSPDTRDFSVGVRPVRSIDQ